MNYLQFSPGHSVYFVIRGDDMQAERYMVNLNFMTIQCISFLAKREKFQKIFNGIFSSWRQSFSSSHFSHRQWNGNKAKSLIYYNDWIQTVENMDKPLNEWLNEKKSQGKTSAIEVSPLQSNTSSIISVRFRFENHTKIAS